MPPQTGPQSVKMLLACSNRHQKLLQTCSKPVSHLRALDWQKKLSGILSTLGERQGMRSQGSRVLKFYGLARIGPKKSSADSQQAYESIARVRSEKSFGKFTNPRWEAAHAQVGQKSAKLLLASSNRPQKSSADPQQNCEALARIRSAKKRVGNFVNPRREAAHSQVGPHSETILVACSNPAPKSFADSQEACESFAPDRSAKKSVENCVNPRWEAAHA